MLDCLIIGDSLAVGFGQAAPHCRVVAQKGIDSGKWLKSFSRHLAPAKTVVVSLGTNDAPSETLARNLIALRQSVQAQRVVWVLPSAELRPTARYYVNYVAQAYGDQPVGIPSSYLGKDRIHLSGLGYQTFIQWAAPRISAGPATS